MNVTSEIRDMFIRSGYTMIGRYSWEYWSNGDKTFQIKDDIIVPMDGKPVPAIEFLERYKKGGVPN